MRKILHTMTLFIILALFTGCAITKTVVGDFYLEHKKYDSGQKYFKNKLKENNSDASSQYYYGRFLLLKKNEKEALVHLKKAVALDNKNADYHSWLAIAYSRQKEYNKEREAYLKALKINKNHLKSLTYLAHNYYEAKEYKNALKYYAKSLKLQKFNHASLYNRALSLNKLRRMPEEKLAWLAYLEYYPSGLFAQKAVRFLNTLGSFDYRNHIIGIRTLTLKNIRFENFEATIDNSSNSSLDLLGKILNKKTKIDIHIVVYQQNNILLAKEIAKCILKYLLKKYPNIDASRLKLSWFDTAKILLINKRKYIRGEHVDFISINEKKK